MSPGSTWREVGAFLTMSIGAAAMLVVAHHHYPLQEWLVFRYSMYWCVGLVWLSACASAGDRVLAGALGVRLPALEAALAGLGCGVVLFFLALFAAGLLGWLRPWFAVSLPMLMLAGGGKQPWSRWSRLVARTRRSARVTGFELAASALGTVALAMIYLTVSTPDNVGFDAQWYHLPIAEHFAAAGRIAPFSEGWYLGAYPHLASVLYAWAFLLPFTQVFDRVLIAAHLEWFLFLVTVFSVPLLLRRVVRSPPRATWTMMFLFPSLLLYDGGLFVGADHVLAFWAIPAYLAVLRVEHQPSTRRVVLLVVLLGGAILTKYQAMYLLLPLGARLLWATFPARGPVQGVARGWRAPVVALACGLGLTSPHWLANALWYGDPFFPALHRHLADHPWTADTDRNLSVFYGAALWQPQGNWLEKVVATARALVTFSFEPHDWPTYHRDVPVFGSLFTVFSFVAPLLRDARRVAHLIVSVLTGVALWFLTSHQDRYLQAILPWMVVSTAAVVVLTARQWPRLRVPIAALIAIQCAWGADVYFIQAEDNSHEQERPSPVKSAVDLASSGYRGDYQERLHPYREWEELGAAVPAAAKVLVHERYLHLGLGRAAVTDLPGWQSGISYAQWETPANIYRALRAMGVTHVVYQPVRSHESDSWAGDLAFVRFVRALPAPAKTFDYFSVVSLEGAESLPEARIPARAAWYGCPPGPGVLRDLNDGDARRPDQVLLPLTTSTTVPHDASWVIVDRTCHQRNDPFLGTPLLHRGVYDVFAPLR